MKVTSTPALLAAFALAGNAAMAQPASAPIDNSNTAVNGTASTTTTLTQTTTVTVMILTASAAPESSSVSSNGTESSVSSSSAASSASVTPTPTTPVAGARRAVNDAKRVRSPGMQRVRRAPLLGALFGDTPVAAAGASVAGGAAASFTPLAVATSAAGDAASAASSAAPKPTEALSLLRRRHNDHKNEHPVVYTKTRTYTRWEDDRKDRKGRHTHTRGLASKPSSVPAPAVKVSAGTDKPLLKATVGAPKDTGVKVSLVRRLLGLNLNGNQNQDSNPLAHVDVGSYEDDDSEYDAGVESQTSLGDVKAGASFKASTAEDEEDCDDDDEGSLLRRADEEEDDESEGPSTPLDADTPLLEDIIADQKAINEEIEALQKAKGKAVTGKLDRRQSAEDGLTEAQRASLASLIRGMGDAASATPVAGAADQVTGAAAGAVAGADVGAAASTAQGFAGALSSYFPGATPAQLQGLVGMLGSAASGAPQLPAGLNGLTGQLPLGQLSGLTGQLPTGQLGGLTSQLPTSQLSGLTGQLPTSQLSGLMSQLSPTQIAGLLSGQLQAGQLNALTGQLPTSQLGALAGQLPTDQLKSLAGQLPTAQLSALLRQLPTDKLQSLAGQLPAGQLTALLGQLPTDKLQSLAGQHPTGQLTALLGQLPTSQLTGLTGQLPLGQATGAAQGLIGNSPLASLLGASGLPVSSIIDQLGLQRQLDVSPAAAADGASGLVAGLNQGQIAELSSAITQQQQQVAPAASPAVGAATSAAAPALDPVLSVYAAALQQALTAGTSASTGLAGLLGAAAPASPASSLSAADLQRLQSLLSGAGASISSTVDGAENTSTDDLAWTPSGAADVAAASVAQAQNEVADGEPPLLGEAGDAAAAATAAAQSPTQYLNSLSPAQLNEITGLLMGTAPINNGTTANATAPILGDPAKIPEAAKDATTKAASSFLSVPAGLPVGDLSSIQQQLQSLTPAQLSQLTGSLSQLGLPLNVNSLTSLASQGISIDALAGAGQQLTGALSGLPGGDKLQGALSALPIGQLTQGLPLGSLTQQLPLGAAGAATGLLGGLLGKLPLGLKQAVESAPVPSAAASVASAATGSVAAAASTVWASATPIAAAIPVVGTVAPIVAGGVASKVADAMGNVLVDAGEGSENFPAAPTNTEPASETVYSTSSWTYEPEDEETAMATASLAASSTASSWTAAPTATGNKAQRIAAAAWSKDAISASASEASSSVSSETDASRTSASTMPMWTYYPDAQDSSMGAVAARAESTGRALYERRSVDDAAFHTSPKGASMWTRGTAAVKRAIALA